MVRDGSGQAVDCSTIAELRQESNVIGAGTSLSAQMRTKYAQQRMIAGIDESDDNDDEEEDDGAAIRADYLVLFMPIVLVLDLRPRIGHFPSNRVHFWSE